MPALLFQTLEENPQTARVDAAQQLLFPSTPRAVCDELGLNWWAALKLYEDGWLSFSPERTQRLDQAQEAELRFVGSLAASGCDRSMLRVLLKDLRKPYAYDLKRLSYDWLARRWRVLTDPHAEPEAAFSDWVERLVQKQDASSLHGIGELALDALSRVQSGTLREPLPQKPWSVTSDGESTQG